MRRGDIVHPDSTQLRHKSFRRGVISEDQLIFAMEVMKKAVLDAGEHHGREIIFHVFTQVVFCTFPRGGIAGLQ